MSDKVISSTTQEFLDVYDIVNDMVLLKDGSAAIILQVGTMNFSLLAEQEQDAVIFTYGSVLNSLNYPIQINIQSQTKDATKYLRLLDEQIAKASSERKAALIKQYRGFVEGLIKERNVLQKRFYIVTSAGPTEMGLITPTNLLPGQSTFNVDSVEKSILLEKANNILEPRRDHLTSQFNRLGLFSRQLTTQEIIQNFYINYNPEAAEGQEISSSENYTTPLVRASFGGKFMQLNNIMQNQAAAQGQVQKAALPKQESSTAPHQELSVNTNQAAAELPVQETQVSAPVETTNSTQPAQTEQPAQPAQVISSSQPSVNEAQVFPPAQELNPPSAQGLDFSQGSTNQIQEIFAQPAAVAEETSPNTEVNLDFKLDSSLLNNQAQDNPIANGGSSQIEEVFTETQQSAPPEQVIAPSPSAEIPPIETAPIIDQSVIAPDPQVQTSEVKVPANPNMVASPEIDFAEEITPLQVQDDTKNV